MLWSRNVIVFVSIVLVVLVSKNARVEFSVNQTLVEGCAGSARIELTIVFGRLTSAFEDSLVKYSLISDVGGFPVAIPATHIVELVG